MRWRGFLTLLVLLLALVPGSAMAQDTETEGSFLLGINSDTYIRPEQSIQTLVVINENAVIDGTVTEALFVINGTATVNGNLTGDVTIISGTLNLGETAGVTKDVVLINSEINQTAGATVGGQIERHSWAFYSWQLTLVSALFWIGSTAVILLAGLLFAAIGGRQVTGAGEMITGRTGHVALTGLIVGIGLPVVAVIAIMTLVGIPVGIAMLIFLLPVLWFTGYLVAGTKLGSMLLGLRKRDMQPNGHPYLAAVIGLLFLQIVAFVPVLGFLFVGLASFMGTGAVAYFAWRAWRGPEATEGPTVTLTTQPAPTG